MTSLDAAQLSNLHWFKMFTIQDPEAFDVDVYADLDGLHISQPSTPGDDDVVHISWAQFSALLDVIATFDDNVMH